MVGLFSIWSSAGWVQQLVERMRVLRALAGEADEINQESSSPTGRKESVDQVLFLNENDDFLDSQIKQIPWKYNDSCF